MPHARHGQDRIDADEGIGGADDDRLQLTTRQKFLETWRQARSLDAIELKPLYNRCRALLDEVTLKRQKAGIRIDHSAHGLIAHWQE